MILIKCGTCGTTQGYKTAADGELSLPAMEEARLVARGVAAYVTKPVIGPNTGVATPQEGENNGGMGANTPPAKSPAQGNEEAALLEGESQTDDNLVIVDGRFTLESLMQLTRANMEQLASDLGVNISKCKNKGDIAVLLSAVEVQSKDGSEVPPELNAEGPVA